jgi:hypothetical protein
MNIKRTPILLKEAKQLYKQGFNYKQIGKKMNLSYTTIGIWIRGQKMKSQKCDGIGDNPLEIPLFIRENLAKQEYNNPLAVEKDRVKRNVCVICGKKKEEKWKLTNFCNLNCFTYAQ